MATRFSPQRDAFCQLISGTLKGGFGRSGYLSSTHLHAPARQRSGSATTEAPPQLTGSMHRQGVNGARWRGSSSGGSKTVPQQQRPDPLPRSPPSTGPVNVLQVAFVTLTLVSKDQASRANRKRQAKPAASQRQHPRLWGHHV